MHTFAYPNRPWPNHHLTKPYEWQYTAPSFLDQLLGDGLDALEHVVEVLPEGVAADDPGNDPAIDDTPVAEVIVDGAVVDTVDFVGGVVSREARLRIFELLSERFELPAIVHATASVSPWARLGPGAQVLARVVVGQRSAVIAAVAIFAAAVVVIDNDSLGCFVE
jgi:hypothetical protein